MSAAADPKILGLILARGGSKRLPGKNIRPLCGKPLIAWTVEAALASSELSKVVVSTDSHAIAEVAAAYGASVPFLRDASLAADLSTSEDAALDALERLEAAGLVFDAVMLLEPTSPLRATGDIPGAARLLARRWREADAVVAVGQVHREHPEVMKTRHDNGFLSPWMADAGRRGNPWFPYAGIYAVKVPVLKSVRSFYPPRLLGYPVERWQNYEVDDECDFLCIEAIMNHRHGKLP